TSLAQRSSFFTTSPCTLIRPASPSRPTSAAWDSSRAISLPATASWFRTTARSPPPNVAERTCWASRKAISFMATLPVRLASVPIGRRQSEPEADGTVTRLWPPWPGGARDRRGQATRGGARPHGALATLGALSRRAPVGDGAGRLLP